MWKLSSYYAKTNEQISIKFGVIYYYNIKFSLVKYEVPIYILSIKKKLQWNLNFLLFFCWYLQFLPVVFSSSQTP